MKKKLTKLQAYNAMVSFLDAYYDKNKSENLSDFITYAFFWFDGKTADPEAWPEWKETLQAMSKRDKNFKNLNRLTHLQALHAMVNFFKLYCSLYVQVPLDMIIVLKMLESLQDNRASDPAWSDWIKSIEDTVVKKDPRVYIQKA